MWSESALRRAQLGGVPIATMISSLTGLPAIFVRKQAKTYGTRRLAGLPQMMSTRSCKYGL